MIYRLVPFMVATVCNTIRRFSEGLGLCVLRVLTSLYKLSNVVIPRLAAPSIIVGYHAGAERMSRVLTSMMGPALQSMFPCSSHLATSDAETAARVGQRARVPPA